MAMPYHCELNLLRSILGQEKDVPMSDWSLDPRFVDEPGDAHVLVFGCPDSNGAYLQATFDEEGRMLRATIVNTGGEPCNCKFCKPKKSRRKGNQP